MVQISGQDKVTAFFATDEAEAVLKCFDKIDSVGAGTVTVADVLGELTRNDHRALEQVLSREQGSSLIVFLHLAGSRNAATDEDGMGLVPRCGTFTLSQAAIEGVFACCAVDDVMDLANFARLFHAYVYPHAPSATRFWFDVIGERAVFHTPIFLCSMSSI